MPAVFLSMHAYIRTILIVILPNCTQHSQVALVTPLSVLLSGGSEPMCLFFGNCFATEAKHEAEQAYRRNVWGTIQGISTPREPESRSANGSQI